MLALAPPPPPPAVSSAPLSTSQRRFWLMDALPHRPPLAVVLRIRIWGAIDVARLRAALADVERRHAALRTTFAIVEGEPRQIARQPGAVDLRCISLAHVAVGDRAACVEQIMVELTERRFLLDIGPLWEATLLSIDRGYHELLVAVHHIACDGWSASLLASEIAVSYRAGWRADRAPGPDPGEWARRERELLDRPLLARQSRAARERLQGARPSRLDPVPIDTRGGRSAAQAVQSFGHRLTRAIKARARTERLTPFMFGVAALATLIARYTDVHDVVIGAPVSVRPSADLEDAIGCFLNTMPLRIGLGDDPDVSTLFARARACVIESYERREVPIEDVLPVLDRAGRAEEAALPILLNMPPPMRPLPAGTPRFELREVRGAGRAGDVTVYLHEQRGALTATVSYDSTRHAAWAMERLGAHLRTVCSALATASADTRVWALPIVTAAERHMRRQTRRLVVPPERSLATELERVAAEHAARIAIDDGVTRWSHAELGERSKRAAFAIASAGVRPPARVAVLADHGAGTVLGMLAAVRAGVAHVILDPRQPVQRLHDIVRDAAPSAIAFEPWHREAARALIGSGGALVDLHEPERTGGGLSVVPPEAVAYLLYTSGTTGTPKGVVQTQRNVLGHMRAYGDALGLTTRDRLTFLTGIGTDAAVMDVFGALLHGATLLPLDPLAADRGTLARRLRASAATIYHSTPTLFRFITNEADGRDFRSVRAVVLGGEAATPDDVARFVRCCGPDCALINGYGPTESTLALQYRCERGYARARVPVGWALPHTRVTLLDREGREAPVRGEIALRGFCVAMGYWNRPDLTNRVLEWHADGTRTYRTGDLGVWGPGGEIEFEGRRDTQVKVRGVRVELEDIEAALRLHDDVENAAAQVVAREAGASEIVAFVVPRASAALDVAALERHARARLPAVMVPTRIIPLPALPTTASGKVDRRRLPPPSPAASGAAATPPRDIWEQQLARAWAQVLGRASFGVNDDFFALGGDSLAAVSVLSRLHEACGVSLPLASFFETRTVAQMAPLLRRARAERTGPLVQLRRGNGSPLVLAHTRTGAAMCYSDLADRLGGEWALWCLQAPALEAGEPYGTLPAMALEYAKAIRDWREGPYRLGGYSFGGCVAFETARQLAELGERVESLILFDTPAPREPREFDEAAFWARRLQLPAADLARCRDRTPEEWLEFAVRELERARRVPAHFSRPGATAARFLGVERAHARAYTEYTPRSYAGSAVVIRAAGGSRGNSPTLGWERWITGSIELHEAPGHHHDLLKPPAVDVVSGIVRGVLERCRSNREPSGVPV